MGGKEHFDSIIVITDFYRKSDQNNLVGRLKYKLKQATQARPSISNILQDIPQQ